jgi:hypothetical protein
LFRSVFQGLFFMKGIEEETGGFGRGDRKTELLSGPCRT